MAEPTTVDEYMATLPDDKRTAMEAIRQAVKSVITEADATETIAYKMPAFRSPNGRFLVSYDAFKNHYSLFPASDEVVRGLGDRITPYLAGKGTIRFPASKPIPTDLVMEIVRIRVAENAAARSR